MKSSVNSALEGDDCEHATEIHCPQVSEWTFKIPYARTSSSCFWNVQAWFLLHPQLIGLSQLVIWKKA